MTSISVSIPITHDAVVVVLDDDDDGDDDDDDDDDDTIGYSKTNITFL